MQYILKGNIICNSLGSIGYPGSPGPAGEQGSRGIMNSLYNYRCLNIILN